MKQRMLTMVGKKKFVAMHLRGVVSDSKFHPSSGSHMNWRRKLTSTVKVLECREHEQYAIDANFAQAQNL